MEPNLEYKYDEYEEDFEAEKANDKNQPALTSHILLQTDPPAEEKKKLQT